MVAEDGGCSSSLVDILRSKAQSVYVEPQTNLQSVADLMGAIVDQVRTAAERAGKLRRLLDVGVDGDGQHVLEADGITIRLAKRMVGVEDRLVPEWAELTNEADEETAGAFVRAEVRNGAPEITEVRLWTAPGASITRALVREFELDVVLRALAAFSFLVNEEGTFAATPEDDAEEESALEDLLRATRRRRYRRVTPALLERVAQIYRDNLDHAPTEAVRKHFVVSMRTASEYVQRARAEGFLPPTTQGKVTG